MPTSRADSIDKVPSGGGTDLRNKPPTSDPLTAPFSYASATPGNDRQGGYGAPGHRYDKSGGGGSRSGGWINRNGGWDRRREVTLIIIQMTLNWEMHLVKLRIQESTNAYEDIPVETSGKDVPPPVNTFADIDLGESFNQNIRRCKYVKPTPVQRYAIPISIAGRDLMACAQTGSGKTAAFCFQ